MRLFNWLVWDDFFLSVCRTFSEYPWSISSQLKGNSEEGHFPEKRAALHQNWWHWDRVQQKVQVTTPQSNPVAWTRKAVCIHPADCDPEEKQPWHHEHSSWFCGLWLSLIFREWVLSVLSGCMYLMGLWPKLSGKSTGRKPGPLSPEEFDLIPWPTPAQTW